MNKLSALWNNLVDSLNEGKDVLTAIRRAREAKDNPQVMQPLASLRQRLQAEGLLDGESTPPPRAL